MSDDQDSLREDVTITVRKIISCQSNYFINVDQYTEITIVKQYYDEEYQENSFANTYAMKSIGKHRGTYILILLEYISFYFLYI